MANQRPARCFISTDSATLDARLTAAVAAGAMTEHDATAVREFAAYLAKKAAKDSGLNAAVNQSADPR